MESTNLDNLILGYMTVTVTRGFLENCFPPRMIPSPQEMEIAIDSGLEGKPIPEYIEIKLDSKNFKDSLSEYCEERGLLFVSNPEDSTIQLFIHPDSLIRK